MNSPATNREQATISLKAHIEALQSIDVAGDANIKFLILLESRLIENNVSYDAAIYIARNVEYDMTAFGEDDDFVSEAAGAYAEYCSKVYHTLISHGFSKNMSNFSPACFRRLFNPLGPFKP